MHRAEEIEAAFSTFRLRQVFKVRQGLEASDINVGHTCLSQA